MLDQTTLSIVAQVLAEAPDARFGVAKLLRELAETLLARTSITPAEQQLDHRRRAHDLLRIADHLAERDPPHRTLREEIATLRERLVLDALARAKNNVARAARALGVSRNLIYEVIERATSGDEDDEVLPR